MGNFNTVKAQPLPMQMVLKRLNEQAIPDDKAPILDFIEMIDIALCNQKTGANAAVLLKELQGVKLILKILKKMLEDAELVQACIQVFETIKLNTPLVMDFIQYGGLDLLEKAIRMHVKDDFISVTCPKLFSILSAIGAGVSRSEIENEGLNLQLCQKCQETIERSKKKDYFQACVVIPRSSERANRVLKFMDNYISREDVQIVGLDAIINFVRNSDGKVQTRETNLIDVLGRSIRAHATSNEVVWRVCMVLTIVVSFHGELANDVALLEIHDVLIDAYPSFERSAAIQQQILWLLAAFLEWPKSKRTIHKSSKCVQFFRDITKALDFTPSPEEMEQKESLADKLKKGGLIPTIYTAASKDAKKSATTAADTKDKNGKGEVKLTKSGSNKDLTNKSKNNGKESPKAKQRKSKTDANAANKAAVGNKGGKNDKDDAPVQEEEVEVIVRKEFELVIPLRVRTFLRETKGEILVEAPKHKEKKNFKQRRNFDERPKFGTVTDRHFLEGADGLIPDGPENEDGEKIREIPDWEKKLNYGEEVETLKKKKKPVK